MGGRRGGDCTINALFYNINEGKVEDWTGLGLSDLQAGVIRTPVDPMVTFGACPLQAVRVFRFADRFDFELDANIFLAARRPEIHALIDKVDPARKAVELEKILLGSQPERTVAHMIAAGIWL